MILQSHGTPHTHIHTPIQIITILCMYNTLDVCRSHINAAQSIHSCRFVECDIYWQYLSTSIDQDSMCSINTNIRYTKREEEEEELILLQVKLS